ncbi:MAG: MFS family permease [Gammaproteobacteria bacterium]|jgi:MFS family permease
MNQIPDFPSTKRANWMLALLTLIFTFNFVDRQILIILQEPIRNELALSDTQLGLLTGLAFVVIYVTVGIPIAHFADRSNRRNIVSLSVFAWSIMTALTGMAQQFWQLLLFRIGVGIGEAGGTPPSHSMIADLFPAEKRATALSIFQTGPSIGILIGFLIGGWIGQIYGWRIAFIVAGLPGILLAALLFFCTSEPRRKPNVDRSEADQTFFEGIRYLFSVPTFRTVALAMAIAHFSIFGVMNFTPSFLIRSYNLSLTEVATTLALIYGIGGGIGTVVIGVFADRLAKRDPRWRIWLVSLCTIVAYLASLAAYLCQSPILSFSFYALVAICAVSTQGIIFGTLQLVINSRSHALMTSIIFFSNNLVGMGLGPLFVGMVSDGTRSSLGIESVRFGLILCATGFLIAAPLYLRAASRLREDILK